MAGGASRGWEPCGSSRRAKGVSHDRWRISAKILHAPGVPDSGNIDSGARTCYSMREARSGALVLPAIVTHNTCSGE